VRRCFLPPAASLFQKLITCLLTDPADDAQYNVNSSLVNRRGIYKDVYGSGEGREWSDYQFRSNFRSSPFASLVLKPLNLTLSIPFF
jgi:hypothetical protein